MQLVSGVTAGTFFGLSTRGPHRKLINSLGWSYDRVNLILGLNTRGPRMGLNFFVVVGLELWPLKFLVGGLYIMTVSIKVIVFCWFNFVLYHTDNFT